MIKRFKFLIVGFFALLIIPFGNKANAAGSFSISASSYQVSVGNTVTVCQG